MTHARLIRWVRQADRMLREVAAATAELERRYSAHATHVTPAQARWLALYVEVFAAQRDAVRTLRATECLVARAAALTSAQPRGLRYHRSQAIADHWLSGL